VEPETHFFEDDGAIPNSPLPVLIYHGVEAANDAGTCEELFDSNGWVPDWRDGIFTFHHFHSIAHEVLGVVAGTATVKLGGPSGRDFEIAHATSSSSPPGPATATRARAPTCWWSAPIPTACPGTFAAVTRRSTKRWWRTCGRYRRPAPIRSRARTAR
jgi:hypothetical protein